MHILSCWRSYYDPFRHPFVTEWGLERVGKRFLWDVDDLFDIPWCSTLWSAPDLLHKRRRVVPAAEFDEFISPPRCGAEMVVTLIHLFSLCLRLWGWAIMSVLPSHLLPRLCHVIQTRRESFLRYFRYTAFVQKWWVRGTSLQTSLVVQVKNEVYDDEMLRRGWKKGLKVSRCKRKRMHRPGVEPGMSRPQREVLTTILPMPGEAGYRSLYLPHAKRALYHLSYIPIHIQWITHHIYSFYSHMTA